MAQAALRHLLLGVAASGLLAGCVAGTGGDTGGGGGAFTATATAARGTGKEVEAPEVFQATDSALWDGRPSLGGIWVASPDAVDPERVVIVNTATGQSVTGALFRRERDNPGPALQVSSDAAEALGMLAGQPTELRVTALRREEAPPQEPAVEDATPLTIAEAPAETPAEAPPVQTEAQALAAAALDATGTTAAMAADGAIADPALATEEPAAPKTWKERRAEAKAKREAAKAQREAEKAAAAAAKAAAEGEVAQTDIAPVDPADSAVASIETAPLDATAPEAVTETPVAPAEAPAASGAVRTIQIATFSKEENARRAVDALSKIDIMAETRRVERNGTPSWSVIARGDASLLTKIRGAGFADAYFLQ